MENCSKDTILEIEEHKKHNTLPPLTHFKHSIDHLLKSEKSLTIMFCINFFQSFQYYVLVTLIPLFFTNELNFSDVQSGAIFGGLGILIGLISLYLSSIMNTISLKRGLFISAFLGIIGFTFFITRNLILSLIGIFIQAWSCAMSWPFIEYGIKMYSSAEFRNISSSCYFMTNYLAGIIAGICIDGLRILFIDDTFVYSIIYSICILFLVISIGFTAACKDVENPDAEDLPIREVIGKKRFWRFGFLILLLILLRSACFGHLDASLPKYMVRMHGEDANFGIMLTVHSITMLLGVFFLTTLAFSYTNYTLIILGALIGTLGSLPLIFNSSMGSLTVFVVCVSVGESIWVPRLLDYTFSIAPEGHEGIYLAMSNCPFYFAMILTGMSSGLLLDTFCPVYDKEFCSLIWVVVFFSGIVIPLALFVLRSYIVQPELEIHPDIQCIKNRLQKLEDLEIDESS
ncbi:hypothetical protein SteCoe_892 [Stentor coeruleus]|uniref:Major facilitator superfamily (MFS) profile domain-containing protein n=1 Tax=Stentor coeruleus TaxID=5963 RepID=A0A1R2D355_9CILI|nr:hypothetical protein SteCoe_892 [Stentor coeruleus]